MDFQDMNFYTLKFNGQAVAIDLLLCEVASELKKYHNGVLEVFRQKAGDYGIKEVFVRSWDK